MRIEAILSAADLAAVAAQFAPARVALGGEGSLTLTDPSEVTLLAGVGVRIVCKAKLSWPVLGVLVPVTLHSLALVVRPEIVTTDRERLVFTLEVEHADLAGVPAFIDKRITEKVNEALAEKRIELAWDFGKTLSHSFALPKSLAPLEALTLTVVQARVIVTGGGARASRRISIARHRSP